MGFAWLSLGTVAGDFLFFGLGVAAVWIGGALAVGRRATGSVGPRTLPKETELDRIRQFGGGLPTLRGERLDVDAEARWAMAALDAEARAGAVGQGIAVTPELAVWMDRGAFRKLLVETLTAAIHSAPGGRVLLTAGLHGGRVQIGISHDGPAPPRDVAELALRPAAELAAMHGGTLEVLSRGGRGDMAVIRLPEPPSLTVRAPENPAAPSHPGPSRAGQPGTPQPADVSLPVRQGLLSA